MFQTTGSSAKKGKSSVTLLALPTQLVDDDDFLLTDAADGIDQKAKSAASYPKGPYSLAAALSAGHERRLLVGTVSQAQQRRTGHQRSCRLLLPSWASPFRLCAHIPLAAVRELQVEIPTTGLTFSLVRY